jgi:hypothetical protein
MPDHFSPQGGRGLPKVLPGPAMPYLFLPCRQAKHVSTAGSLRPCSTPLNTPLYMPDRGIHLSKVQLELDFQDVEALDEGLQVGVQGRHVLTGVNILVENFKLLPNVLLYCCPLQT